jgi:uncharacterized protein (TIGR00369 family)
MRLARLLSTIERFVPGLALHARTWFVERGVPMNRSMGLRVEEVAPDSSRVALRLPPRRRNQNDAGTVHGGVITAFAETVHGVAVLWQFSPARHHMVTRQLRVEFCAPGRGTLRVEYRLDPSTLQAIEGDLARGGRSEFTLVSEVKNESGKVVARLEASYLLRRRSGLVVPPGQPGA